MRRVTMPFTSSSETKLDFTTVKKSSHIESRKLAGAISLEFKLKTQVITSKFESLIVSKPKLSLETTLKEESDEES